MIIVDDQPAQRWEDGFVSGNGRHGALVHGSLATERCVITHHALVLPNSSEHAQAPLLAERIDEIRALLLRGESAAALALSVPDGPRHDPQRFHPAFAVDLHVAEPASRYRRSVDFETGVVGTEANGIRAACFVSRADDVVVRSVWCAAPTDLTVRHVVRLPGCPENLDSTVFTESTRDGAIGTVRVGYPRGGGYTGVTRLVTDGQCQLGAEQTIAVHGATWLTMLARVSKDHDQSRPRASILALPTDWGLLLARHVALHRPAMRRVRLELGTLPRRGVVAVGELLTQPEPELVAALFESGRYLLLCASGLLPPRLPGLWQGDWHAAWSGAITCDANVNLVAAAAASTAIDETIEALAALVEASLPDWRANASRIFGAGGIVAPAHTDGTNGRSYHFSADYPLHLWSAGADWLLTPLLDHIAATHDTGLLARMRPVLAELACFYRDFLHWADADGEVVIAPSYSPENHPLGQTPVAVNATMDIAAAKHALNAAVDACAGSEEDIAEWQRILDRLPPYRINADGALAEWIWPTLADRYDHRHVSHLYPVWPLREINPIDTPDLAAAATTALRLRTAENDSAHGHLHRALCAARLGDAELVSERLGDLLTEGFFFRSLMSSHYPALSVYNADTACGLPGLITETLVSAHPARGERPGRILLLPAVPGMLPTGRISGVPTVTGVTVRSLEWHIAERSLRAVFESTVECQIEIYICAWKCESTIVNLSSGESAVLLCSTGSTRIVTSKCRASSG